MATGFSKRLRAPAVMGGAMIALTLWVAAAEGPAITMVDTVDPRYGGKVRQLRQDDGHEHNLYYNRNPWNADGTRLVVIHSDRE